MFIRRMSVKSFESLRVILIVVSMLLRLCVMPIYLQAYLNMAYDRTRALKNEVGKISNIDLQKTVSVRNLLNWKIIILII